MSDKKFYLGQFEESVLLTVARLGNKAYGVPIRKTVETVTGRRTSIGAIYTTLERLEQKGFVSSYQGEPTAQRGGRAKQYYKLEAAGREALNETQRIRTRLQEGLTPDLQPSGSTI